MNGAPAPHVEGCYDVDLEASAFTNAFPVRRLGARPRASRPRRRRRTCALRICASSGSTRAIAASRTRLRAAATTTPRPQFEFEALLVYDEHGFVLDYPGIAERAA